MGIKMSGMVSGLDTDSIVQALVSAQRTKVTNLNKKKTKTEWKIDAWKDLNAKIYSLYTGTLDSLRWSDSYNAKKSSISKESVATVKSSSNAPEGAQSLIVKQVAKSGYLTGGNIATNDSSKLSSSTTLSQLGYTGGDAQFSITVGGKESKIELSANSTISDLVSQLSQAGVKASLDVTNGRIFVNSKTSGKEGDFEFSATSTDGLKALQSLGLYAASDSMTASYKEWSELSGINSYNTNSNDAKQLAYNAKYEAILENNKKAYQKAIDDATKAREDLAKAEGYNSYNDFAAALGLSGSSTSADMASKQSDLEKGLEAAQNKATALSKDCEDLNKKINETSDATQKANLEAQLKTKQEELTKVKEEITDTTKKISNVSALKNNTEKIEKNTGNLANAESIAENEMNSRIAAAVAAQTADYSSGAVKITGQDSVIELNGAEFTSSTNSFSINGLNITAQEESAYTTDANGDKKYETTTITTSADNQAVYDTIKKFIKEYNALIKEMDTLYNADNAKGYEPLSDEEQDVMTDTQIEKWEKKVKDSLLRRDSTLGDVSSALKIAMNSVYEINGTKYNLATFGISTGGYFTSDKNERGCYHIDGDSEDTSTANNEDKLLKALSNDPEGVVSFFQSLANTVYDTIGSKMKSITGVRSAYKVYNDKTLDKEVDDYEDKIKKLEAKIAKEEEKYYSQFSAMEVALQKLQQNTSSLAGLLGSAS